MLTLLALAVALRATGAVLRTGNGHGMRVGGWVLCMLATWTGAGVAGIWIPLWSVVPVAMAGALLEARTQDPRWLAVGDVLLLGLAAVGATPPPPWATFFALTVGVGALASGVEAWARLAPRPLRLVTPVLGTAAAVVLGARLLGEGDPLQPLPRILPSLALSPPCAGERVELESGGVAWYDRPRGSGSHPGAVVLHGADPRGSRQPAACSLRRALGTAGFATLALDHPGYGESPAPDVDAPLEDWDPRVAEAEAVDTLAAKPEVDSVLLVAGHSMGGTGALRLLAKRPAVPMAVLFGVGLTDHEEREDYWYERFHQDRGLDGRMSEERWREIVEAHYRFGPVVGELPQEGPHVVFATFGREWENVEETRDVAYHAIPLSKERWHLPRASHYFSAFTWHGLVAADGRVTRAVAHGIQARAWGSTEGVEPPPR